MFGIKLYKLLGVVGRQLLLIAAPLLIMGRQLPPLPYRCRRLWLVYGSETWAVREEDVKILKRAENMMCGWMCTVTLKDRKSSEELRGRLGIKCVRDVVRCGRLRWFGHVERRSV